MMLEKKAKYNSVVQTALKYFILIFKVTKYFYLTFFQP